MRWGVVSLILGWTIGLVSVPLVAVGLYSLYVEGFEQAIRTFALPAIISLSLGYWMISRSGVSEPSPWFEIERHSRLWPLVGSLWS